MVYLMLSRFIAMCLEYPLGIGMNSPRNGWASPESIKFWLLKVRYLDRVLRI